MTKRSDLQERVEGTAKLLLLGYRPAQIVRTLVQRYAIDERTAKRYIQSAKKALKFDFDDMADDFQLDLRRCEHVYQQALEEGNHANALKALSEKNSFRQAYFNYQMRANNQQPEVDLSFLGDL